MIDKYSKKLSIKQQCKLLEVNKSTFYYKAKPTNSYELAIKLEIDKLYLNKPYLGSRGMTKRLKRIGYQVNRKRTRRLMSVMRLEAIYRKPRMTNMNSEHKKYPYLLKNIDIKKPNQVWCTDITYIPMRKGFLYMVAIMDWYSRHILSWKISNTLDTDFCIDALEEAISKYGKPEIFNSDQGSQFTSKQFTGKLIENGIKISMDGAGRAIDNIFIERFWRTFKYEEVYLKAYETTKDAILNIGEYIWEYNNERPHSSLSDSTPSEVYFRRCLIQNQFVLI